MRRSSCSEGVEPSPILIFDRMLDLPMDDLVRPIEIGPVDRGPKSRMPRDQSIPRLLEGRRVELAAKPTDELLDVVSRLGIGERMEEHSFLHRREGIQILDAAAALRSARSTASRSMPSGASSNGAIADAEFSLEP